MRCALASLVLLSGAAYGQGVPGIPDNATAATDDVEQVSIEEQSAAPPPLERGDEILVRGLRERMSSWKRLETDEMTLFSNGRESEMRRVAMRIERLDALLGQMLGATDPPVEREPLTVVLIGGRDFVSRMGLRSAYAQASGFDPLFDNERYYAPSEFRTLLAVIRRDQIISTQTLEDFVDSLEDDPAFGLDFDEPQFGEFADALDDPFFEDPLPLQSQRRGRFASPRSFMYPVDSRPDHSRFEIERPWEAQLYGAYAEHYLLTNFPAAYPRWYLDSINAIFSTIDLHSDGRMEFGRLPDGYGRVLDMLGPLNSGPILTGTHLAEPEQSVWSPYHALLLAHFFLIGNQDSERKQQFLGYLARVTDGEPAETAAAMFGDFTVLDAEIESYRRSRKFYNLVTLRDPAPDDAFDFIGISVSNAEALQFALLLESRIEAYALPGMDEAKGAQLRDHYLAQLRARAGENPDNINLAVLQAEAECRAGMAAECLATADRILLASPDNHNALNWRALALLQQAASGGEEEADAARKAIVAANRVDTEAVLPLLAFYRSLNLSSYAPSELATLGLIKVVAKIPAAPEPRLLLGADLVQRGEAAMAREVLLPVLNTARDSSEHQEAQRLLALL